MACTPAVLADAVLSKGLSPISSSTTSLPAVFNDLATASTVKAVSTDKDRANWLSCAVTECVPHGKCARTSFVRSIHSIEGPNLACNRVYHPHARTVKQLLFTWR